MDDFEAILCILGICLVLMIVSQLFLLVLYVAMLLWPLWLFIGAWAMLAHWYHSRRT